ncbi:MAG: hypothetical protein L6R19_12165 [Alphaproteobacteria bacterium]|nr:hypothetical protein [Alphaproteobacteria bacterium]
MRGMTRTWALETGRHGFTIVRMHGSARSVGVFTSDRFRLRNRPTHLPRRRAENRLRKTA